MTTVHGALTVLDAFEEDVRQILIAEVNQAFPSRLTANKNIWRGPVRPVNNKAKNHEGVFVLMSAGRDSMPYLAADGTELRPRVQIRVRSSLGSGAYTTGAQLSRHCFFAVDQFPPPAFQNDGTTPIVPVYTPTSPICDLRATSSAPIYIGPDSDGHHEWSINVEGVLVERGTLL